MQNYLSARLAELRAQKQNRRFCDTPTHQLARKVAKAVLAVRLGVLPPEKVKKGVTGALIYTDLNGKELGIFKPVRQDILGFCRHISARRVFGI